MAVVFRARDERLHRLVALKVLAPALAGDEEFRQRFIRESRAAAAVDDPHIIPVFEAGEAAAGALFIAMRFVPGGDVYSLVRRTGPLSAARAVAIVSPVASALDAAHAAGLVHRDVKPANMLLDTRPGRPDHVYLSDFGLSKGTVSTSTGLTGAGHFMGTLDYISPERIEGHQADGRADQYALACSAFEMLTGAPPFRSGEPAALMYAQLRQPPPALTSRRPDLPAAADQVLARALAKNPADRYASCRDFADATARGVRPRVLRFRARTHPGRRAPAGRGATRRPQSTPPRRGSTRRPGPSGPPPRTTCPARPSARPARLPAPPRPAPPRPSSRPVCSPCPARPARRGHSRRAARFPARPLHPLVTRPPLPAPSASHVPPRRTLCPRAVRSPRRIRASRPGPPEAIPPRHPGRARGRPRSWPRRLSEPISCAAGWPAARWPRSRSPRRHRSRR